MKKVRAFGNWEVKIKRDGVPIIDAKAVKDKDLEDIFNKARLKG